MMEHRARQLELPSKPFPLPCQVFNEDRKQINGLLLVHLPDGPTAQFRLSNLVLSTDIKVGDRESTAQCSAAAGTEPQGSQGGMQHAMHGMVQQAQAACMPVVHERTPCTAMPLPDPQNHARATSHRPELVLNNFDTRLGHRVGRMFASLFHQVGAP